MLPMATGFIFWIIMQAKIQAVSLFSQVTACPAILLKISLLIW